jgi:hypothetical protein
LQPQQHRLEGLPAGFSLAHGGKDRHPCPVPIKVYDETIRIMKSAVRNAKLGRDEEIQALKRLDDQARRLEVRSPLCLSDAENPMMAGIVDGDGASIVT